MYFVSLSGKCYNRAAANKRLVLAFTEFNQMNLNWHRGIRIKQLQLLLDLFDLRGDDISGLIWKKLDKNTEFFVSALSNHRSPTTFTRT